MTRLRVEVHKYQNLEWKPVQIQGSAFSPNGKELALSREDNRIEIWSFESDDPKNWHLSKTLRLKKKNKDDEADLRTLAWCETQLIVGTKEGNKIITCPRLFSSGFDGVITEWSLYSLTSARDLQVNGGAIWDLKANPSRDCLAAACQDGKVRLYGMEGGGGMVAEEDLSSFVFPQLVSKHVFTCLNTPVMSLCWLPRQSKKISTKPLPCTKSKKEKIDELIGDSDSEDEDEEDEEEEVVDRVATGGMGVLKIHTITHRRRGAGTPYSISYVSPVVEEAISAKISRAHGTNKKIEGKKKKHEKALCWKVAPLLNGDLVTVDSYGQVSFWCGRTGTLLKAITQSQYDVISLAVDSKHSRIFAGDVTGEIYCYECRPYDGEEDAPQEEGEWVVMSKSKPSSYDVTALSLSPSGKILISGSTDCHIRALSAIFGGGNKGRRKREGREGALMKVLRDFPPSLFQKPVCHMGEFMGEPTFVSLTPNQLDILRLGKFQKKNPMVADHLAQVKTANGNLFLVGAKDLSKIIIARLFSFSVYSLSLSEEKTLILKKIYEQHTSQPITNLIYSSLKGGNFGEVREGEEKEDEKGILGVVHSSFVEAFATDNFMRPPKKFSLGDYATPTTISCAAITGDGGLLAVADTNFHIHIFNLSNGGLFWTKNIGYPVATMAFQVSSLLVTTAENKVYLLDALVKSESEWTQEYGTSFDELTKCQYPITGTSFHPNDNNLVVLWGWNYMFVYHFQDAPIQGSSGGKKLKRKHNEENSCGEGNTWRMHRYDHTLFIDWASRAEAKDQEALVVTLPWASVLKSIPPRVKKHKYLH